MEPMTDRTAKPLTDQTPLLPVNWYRDTNGVVRYKDTDNPVLCGKAVGRTPVGGTMRCSALFGHEGPCRA